MAVISKDRKRTKVRVVYDGSAKASKQEKSLNDCLQTGPNHLPHIFNMLANFCKNLIGPTADIEKAFLMDGIQKDHQHFLRFLWFDDPSTERPNVIHLKFTRLVFGLRPSQAILGAIILHHLELQRKSDPQLTQLLEKSFYVDDLLTGEDNDKTAFAIYKRAKKLMSEGGFNLRKWKTNSQQLQETISKEESVTKSNSENVSEDNNKTCFQSNTQVSSSNTSSDDYIFVKVLGMNWNTDSDEVIFSVSKLTEYAVEPMPSITQKDPCLQQSTMSVECLRQLVQALFQENYRQAKHIKENLGLTLGSSEKSANDPLMAVLELKKSTLPGFIREVVCNDLPTITLYTDRQIDNVVEFCCHSKAGLVSELAFDITFQLGPFYVLVTTYKNTLLKVKNGTNSPSCLGPIMVCMTKEESMYLSFIHCLLRAVPGLSQYLMQQVQMESLLSEMQQQQVCGMRQACYVTCTEKGMWSPS